MLTATPIPRTLYMSLAKIKDMSLINTPPLNRLPIETFVMEFNEGIIKQAIQREAERGGQVFFLHNRVQTISHIYNLLSRLVPEQRVAVAHGKMQAHDLEDIMHEFINKNYDILLSTTIIEKNKANFLAPDSSKYLFNQKIIIDNAEININEVDNFEAVSPTDINLLFITIQGLHSRLNNPTESSITYEELADNNAMFLELIDSIIIFFTSLGDWLSSFKSSLCKYLEKIG